MRTHNFFSTLICCCLLFLSCDSSDEGQSATNPLFATWIVQIVQISENTLEQAPPNGEAITITFEADGTFTGATTANTFGGRYEFRGETTLIFLDFSTTEVADTPFAGVFYDAITEAITPGNTSAQFGYSFESQNLVLIFGNNGRMVLQKQESL